MPLTTQQVIQALLPLRDQWKRPAWKPVTKSSESSRTASKFGGQPWLSPDEVWPCCSQCGTLMPLFLQLDLDDLPELLADTFGSGLLQLFYCTECDDAWEPFSPSSLVRVIQPSGDSAEATSPSESFPVKTITQWKCFDDFPNPQDHEALGLDYTYDFEKPLRTTVTCPALNFIAEVIRDGSVAERIGSAKGGDKLAGWPHWVQGAEYPSCPRCQQQMRLVFQLDSNDHLPFMFGDVGTGHVTQCPKHKDVVAFGWACG